MIRRLTLEERVARLERKLKPTNEIAPALAKIIPLIIKNLPLILNMLPTIIEAFKSDQINDNSDKIELLEQFTEIGQKVVDLFNNAQKEK